MRITEIERHDYRVPYSAFNAAAIFQYHGPVLQTRTLLVVKTDTGLEGYGESFAHGLDLEGIRTRYVGTDPFDWIADPMHLPMNMAMYDLMGKHLDMPAWKLMGQQHRQWAPVAFWTVSREPEAMAQEVQVAAAQGYKWLKYHVDEMQNVIDQTEAMQKAAPEDFKIHYDFNANSNVYTMMPFLKELERYSVVGRFEDVINAQDEDGYRLVREKCDRPVIGHHAPPEFMIKHLIDGYMSGHAPIGMSLRIAAMAETTNTPIMYQNTGGGINQAFQAHLVSTVRMATIDHVNLYNLYEDDVIHEKAEIVGGCVAVPAGPGLGVTINHDKLEKYKALLAEGLDKGPRFLVRIRYSDGLTVYQRHEPWQDGQHDHHRFLERLTKNAVPTRVPRYDSPIHTDHWQETEDPSRFEQMWARTEDGPIYE